MKRIQVGKIGENLFADANTGIIYFRMYRAGVGRIERSTKTTNINEARITARAMQNAFFSGNDLRGSSLVFSEWNNWLQLQKTKAINTYTSIEVQGRLHILPFFGPMRINDINEATWENYIANSKSKNARRKMFNDRKYFAMFLNHLHRQGLIKKVPRLRNPDPELKAGKVYTEQEIQKLLNASNQDLKLQILMGVTMGMRRSEILLLEWDRVDLEKNFIYLRAEDTKIRKARTFAISPQVLSLLHSRKALGQNSPFVFCSPKDPSRSVGRLGNEKAWSGAKKVAGVSGRFHDLRHTFLTNAFKLNINPMLVCHYAGLSIEEAQRTYLHFSNEDTRKVIDIMSQNE